MLASRRLSSRSIPLSQGSFTDFLGYQAPDCRLAFLSLASCLLESCSLQYINGPWVELPGPPLNGIVPEVGLVDGDDQSTVQDKLRD